jgi:hypothetical protein
MHDHMHDEMLDETGVAGITKLARATLAKMRVTGGGPPFVKIRSRVLYPYADLCAWLARQPRRRSTSDTSGLGDDE